MQFLQQTKSFSSYLDRQSVAVTNFENRCGSESGDSVVGSAYTSFSSPFTAMNIHTVYGDIENGTAKSDR